MKKQSELVALLRSMITLAQTAINVAEGAADELPAGATHMATYQFKSPLETLIQGVNLRVAEESASSEHGPPAVVKRANHSWTDAELDHLRRRAAEEANKYIIAEELGRTPAAITSKACVLKISLTRKGSKLAGQSYKAAPKEKAWPSIDHYTPHPKRSGAVGRTFTMDRGPKNSCRPWTDDDDEFLVSAISEKMPPAEIAATLGRTEKACEVQWCKIRKREAEAKKKNRITTTTKTFPR